MAVSPSVGLIVKYQETTCVQFLEESLHHLGAKTVGDVWRLKDTFWTGVRNCAQLKSIPGHAVELIVLPHGTSDSLDLLSFHAQGGEFVFVPKEDRSLIRETTIAAAAQRRASKAEAPAQVRKECASPGSRVQFLLEEREKDREKERKANEKIERLLVELAQERKELALEREERKKLENERVRDRALLRAGEFAAAIFAFARYQSGAADFAWDVVNRFVKEHCNLDPKLLKDLRFERNTRYHEPIKQVDLSLGPLAAESEENRKVEQFVHDNFDLLSARDLLFSSLKRDGGLAQFQMEVLARCDDLGISGQDDPVFKKLCRFYEHGAALPSFRCSKPRTNAQLVIDAGLDQDLGALILRFLGPNACDWSAPSAAATAPRQHTAEASLQQPKHRKQRKQRKPHGKK